MSSSMRPAFVIASALLAFLVSFTSAVAAPAGSDAYPGRNGQLLFIRQLSVNNGTRDQLLVAAPDGTGVREITPPGFWVVHSAAWSPDGKRIAFSGLRDDRNGAAIFVIDANGGGLRMVTRGDRRELRPTWSPDGKSLAFTSFDRGLEQIFRSRLDGSGRKVLSSQTTNCNNAEWSPTGGAIVFECGLPGGLVIMRPDGSRERKLTRQREHRTDYSPAWSPDGRTILFSRGGWTYRVRPDGGGLARTVRATGERAISPDGKWMALTRYLDSQQEVWVMRRDGRDARTITDTIGTIEHAPDWQPLR